jgi:D-serine deaminase-like pyridoxal phosphate-dependent protein
MPSVNDVSTPAVLIDVDVLERNIARMAERARAAGVRLRPHGKTHKLLEVGRLQLGAGAGGLSLAKTSEAEVFAAAGFDDIFVAYPVVGADKGRRLLALAEKIRLAVGVDSVDGARTLGGVFAAAGRRLDVRLKIDSGLHRVGVLPEQAVGVARAIADLPGLQLTGVFTHAGHAYGETDAGGVAAVGHHEGGTMSAVAEALRRAGLEIREVSVGSTPTARHAMTVAGVTECRPGNYVYHDASQVSLGTCGLEDCAMTVVATVVSVPAPDRAVLDAGSKTLSTDPLRPRAEGHGWVLGRKARVSKLSEEHGVLAVEEGERFRVGERVRVLPNHACVVSNLHDRVLAVRGETVEAEWKVAARGRVE